ncbi:hypothetical protein D9619_009505 [Psilocybe cf. subviscida]|uniref:NACHT domain-containing protein n=1 Tax=Psilocybe cf. subviscida TaxID=2480587 RepID=A0A8H5FAQ4_9AGAR|nr:hypothetical protein D9619_009505 [Psilocybe cf. subviscida]
MDTHNNTNYSRSNIRIADEIPLKQPVSLSGTSHASVLDNAIKPRIRNSVFSITSISTVDRSPLHMLYNCVAPNAILNAGGRADEVRCHPGTRKEVIRVIERWMDAPDNTNPPMMWLSGPAGAGKTAIVQTVAERCKRRDVPHANFFFFRADSSRCSTFPLVATLVYQICQIYPAVRETVATTLSDNPLILHGSIEEQLSLLPVEPLRNAQRFSASDLRVVLLIDGLDECSSETKISHRQILYAIDNALVNNYCPLRVLVASRFEHQITMAFNQLSASVHPLYLDEQYSPESDIRHFVVSQFMQVKKTHPLAYQLHATWPSVKDMDHIVKKSSGQFIYASTVMRYISNSSASPRLSLERVHCLAQVSTSSPFSQLDAVYTYILSQADDQEALKDIIHCDMLIKAMLRWRTNVDFQDRAPTLERIVGMLNPRCSADVLRSCLADLTSIAAFESGYLSFHHASLRDYFLDQTRSGSYFVDLDAFSVEAFPEIWEHIGKEHSV